MQAADEPDRHTGRAHWDDLALRLRPGVDGDPRWLGEDAAVICPECAKPRDLFTPGSDLPMCWTAKRKVWFCLKHDIEVPG